MDQKQLELLWEYQQEDMKALRLDNEIRRSPTRQKLEKDRKLFSDKQQEHKQIEEQVGILTDRKDIISDAIAKCSEQLKNLTARFESDPPADLDGTMALMKEVSRLRDTVAGYEREMQKMSRDAADFGSRQNRIRTEAAKIRAEYDQLKTAYETETAETRKELEAQKAAVKAKGEGIDAELMAEYMAIRKHIAPPVAKLINNQCSGCNTAQPSAQLRKVKSGEIAECETCGRMLIQ